MIRHTDLDIARVEVFNTWAKEQLSSEQGRASLWKAWKESIIGLESGVCLLFHRVIHQY